VKQIGILLLAVLLMLTGCAPAAAEPEKGDGPLKIVATVFPAYDFARAAAGDRAEVRLLLPPGAESHSYEPTPADILAVQECDLFLSIGGESEAWVDTILDAVRPGNATLRMMDCVELLDEEIVEGMETEPGHEHGNEHGDDHDHGAGHLGEVVEKDEHVWTSPRNAAKIVHAVAEKLAEIDAEHAAQYLADGEAYEEKILALDREFEEFFAGSERETIVFGDRFPLRYFADRYDLDYAAAFPGCGTQTEPSAATVAYLTDRVIREGISTVWYIEFSNHLVADSIAEATGARTAMFHTCHNVSAQELASGATYCSLMEGNLEALKENYG